MRPKKKGNIPKEVDVEDLSPVFNTVPGGAPIDNTSVVHKDSDLDYS